MHTVTKIASPFCGWGHDVVVSAWPLPHSLGVRSARNPAAWTALFGLGGATPFSAYTGPDNETSTRDTIRLMAAIAQSGAQGAGSPAVGHAAREVASFLPSDPSPHILIGAVFAWVRSRVKLVRDEHLLACLFDDADDADLLITPAQLLSMPEPQGDCDCMSMLTAALLLRLGVPCSYITIAADPERPERWSHVYVGAHTPAGIVALDTSHGTHAGWEYGAATRKRIWEVMLPCTRD